MMKKIIAFVLVGVMACFMMACGKNSSEPKVVVELEGEEENEVENEVEEEPQVGVDVESDTTPEVPDGEEDTPTSDTQQPTTQQPTTQQPTTQEPTQTASSFFNDTNYAVEPNALSIRPRRVYWENGELVAECFVINGFPTTAYNIRVAGLSFDNGNGVFASASFGTLNNATIASNSYIIWTFHFGSDCLSKTNVDLQHLICGYDTYCSH